MGMSDVGSCDGDDPPTFLSDMVTIWEQVIDHTLSGEPGAACARLFPQFWIEPSPPPQFGSSVEEAIDHTVPPLVAILTAMAEKLPASPCLTQQRSPSGASKPLACSTRRPRTAGTTTPSAAGSFAATFDRLLEVVTNQGQPDESEQGTEQD